MSLRRNHTTLTCPSSRGKITPINNYSAEPVRQSIADDSGVRRELIRCARRRRKSRQNREPPNVEGFAAAVAFHD
jgi:hypothetical protein